MSTHKKENPFLVGNIPQLYFRTALPIIIVFLVNGFYNLVNAWFVGRYLGEAALSAVTLVFPMQMVLFAFATLFSSGMASVVARRIGAGDFEEAGRVFTNAHVMVAVLFGALALLYAAAGDSVIHLVAGELSEISALGSRYIAILVYCSPILGILVLNTDALRSEGRVKFMSSVMLFSALLNAVFDAVFIARLGFGIEASAYATVLAQIVSLTLVGLYRWRGKSAVSLRFDGIGALPLHLKKVLPLGIPMSLSHVGVAIAVGVVNHALLTWAGGDYQTLAGAYGIVLRLTTFAILPLIGLGVALQTILGNNYGAELHDRVRATFRLGVQVVFVYCTIVETLFMLSADVVGGIFVGEGAMAAEAGRIGRFVLAAFVLFGPVFIVSSYFQAIGRAKQAIMLGLSKNYLFLWPLVMTLPWFQGERGIWWSFPVADVLAAMLALLVFRRYGSQAEAVVR